MLLATSKKKQTFVLILLAIALCISTMGLTAYFLATNIIEKEAENAYQISLQRTKDRIESYFHQINQAILQFETNAIFEKWSIPDAPVDNLEMQGLLEIMLRIQSSLDWVDNVALYRVSNSKLYSTNVHVTATHKEYTEILDAFEKSNKESELMNIHFHSTPVTVYIRKLPIFKSNKNSIIIMHINQRFFDEMLGLDEGKSGNYFILDDRMEILQSKGSIDIESLQRNVVPFIKGGSAHKPHHYFVSYLPPSYTGWTYGFALENQEIFRKLQAMRNGVLLLSGVFLLFAAVFAFLTTNRLWKGWREIVIALSDNGSVHPSDKSPQSEAKDEFRQIYDKVLAIKVTEKKLREQVNELLPDYREAFIRKILVEGIRFQEDIDKTKKYGILPVMCPYCCLCIQIDQYKKVTNVYSETDLYYFDYGLQKVISEVIESVGSGFAVKMGQGQFIGVISLKERTYSDYSVCVKGAQMIRDFIRDYFPFTVSVGLSRLREDLAYLNVSREEAEEAVKQRLTAGPSQVIEITDTETIDQSDCPVSFKELSNDLFHSLRNRDIAQAYLYVDTLSAMEGLRGLNVQWIQSQLTELIYTLFRNVREMLSNPPAEPTLHEMLNLHTIPEWIQWIKTACIDLLHKAIEDEYIGYMQVVAKRLTEYVKCHLESEITLESSCKDLIIPVTIGRQALKTVYDTTFTDFLLNERIEQAKRWLVETDLGIDEISSKLLYSKNFSRTFKKVTGVPPGQYRKEQKHT